MAICPKCTSWLLINEQNTDWVKCNQGHHYRKGEIKHETVPFEHGFDQRRRQLPENHEFDINSVSYKPRRNWNF